MKHSRRMLCSVLEPVMKSLAGDSGIYSVWETFLASDLTFLLSRRGAV